MQRQFIRSQECIISEPIAESFGGLDPRIDLLLADI